MCSHITEKSMELIAWEIMEAVQNSSGMEDGISRIQEILESNGVVEVIPDIEEQEENA
jgi:hypothetical protein